MAVYVDDCQNPLGRMKMAHMVADTREELDAMADRIGLNRRHIQYQGTVKEHYDVSQAYRLNAIEAGAVPVTRRQLVRIVQKRRKEQGK